MLYSHYICYNPDICKFSIYIFLKLGYDILPINQQHITDNELATIEIVCLSSHIEW